MFYFFTNKWQLFVCRFFLSKETLTLNVKINGLKLGPEMVPLIPQGEDGEVAQITYEDKQCYVHLLQHK